MDRLLDEMFHLCLFARLAMFYGFYHGKSTFFTTICGIFLLFPTTKEANLTFSESTRFILPTPKKMGSGKWSSFSRIFPGQKNYPLAKKCSLFVSGKVVLLQEFQLNLTFLGLRSIYLQFLIRKLKSPPLGRNLGVVSNATQSQRPRRNLKAMLVMEPPVQQCWPRQRRFFGNLRFGWCSSLPLII